MRRISLIPLLLVCVACSDPSPEFAPGSYIDKLRILGVRAEPPDIAPGQSTHLDALVADPLEGARETNAIWLVCPPTAEGESSVCTQESALRNPEEILKSPPDGLEIVPFLKSFDYDAPADVLDRLPEGSVARRKGMTATVLLIVFEGHDLEALKARQVEMQVAMKQFRIAPVDASLNHNPKFGNLTINGSEWAPSASADVSAVSSVQLAASATEDSVESFERLYDDGTSTTEAETMSISWYTTRGRFRSPLNANARTSDGDAIRLDLPTASGPNGDDVLLYAVLRDARGGIDWVMREMLVK